MNLLLTTMLDKHCPSGILFKYLIVSEIKIHSYKAILTTLVHSYCYAAVSENGSGHEKLIANIDSKQDLKVY